MMRKTRTLSAFLLLTLARPLLCAETPEPPGAGRSEAYFRMAKAYADAMLADGRDVYGAVHSPAFVATLDLRTMRMPERTSETTRKMYSDFFRAEDYSTSANPMYHVDLYQLLDRLTEVTGDARYRRAKEAALGWFFRHAQSPATGLLAWGEHLGWDLIEDKITVGNVGADGVVQVSDIHEFYGPWIHWDTCFQEAPEATRRFALGLWRHQIYDPATCEFSRHARYSKHAPGRGYEFARQAGFYLDTWASVYRKTRDPELLEAVERMTAALGKWRNRKSGLIPFERRSPQVVFVLHNLSFMVDGWNASLKLPPGPRDELQALVGALDEAVARIEHDLGPEGKGFAKIVDADTAEVSNRGMAEARPGYSEEFINQRYAPYGGLWASTYGAGSYTDARHALLSCHRYRQVERDEYRRWTVATADRYLASLPDAAGGDLTPKTLAPVMALLHGAYRLTGDAKYLAHSEALAELAIERLFREGVPLPYATSRRDRLPYYASISYGDSLMLMFLDLWLLREGRRTESEPQCTIR